MDSFLTSCWLMIFFSGFLSQHYISVSLLLGKESYSLKLSRGFWTSENHPLCIYSLWLYCMYTDIFGMYIHVAGTIDTSQEWSPSGLLPLHTWEQKRILSLVDYLTKAFLLFEPAVTEKKRLLHSGAIILIADSVKRELTCKSGGGRTKGSFTFVRLGIVSELAAS